ncbi:hypothetical protein ThidrDRAFT_3214 [Thiorhodococcus drewsii AZ1]|uniref:Addiction module antitoxin n=1 Tax=Thiorhodococcus drewsii AZ1 TaxID=765913 RepID=G2E4K1_9GAMM|nr:hypothetical protein [Thiorhodococcus drewsii]EGV29622.1 hypothetical protein ThidrDRAFT_3214 [Thiorhodococcus drewsii AZ1]
MQWIDEKALETWAGRMNARDMLMDMLADLIRMTIDDATRFRFPSGEVGQLRGWDGDLETAEAKSFVPGGKSKWEFGTGPGATKATADYKKRTEQTPEAEMAENTLVLVNLGCWDTPKKKISEWETDRLKEGKWKDVRYLDGVQLVQWLKDHPAIAARYARNVLGTAPQEGALSTDEYWEEFSTQFKPPLTEKLVIADRQREADELIAKLCGPADSFMLGAETSEEVIAFAVAAIRCAAPAVRESLESRTLIIRTQAAARFFQLRTGLVFIAMGEGESLVGALGRKCPTLSAATGALAKRGAMLKRPTASGMVDGFIEMGLDHGQGYELAHRCGRSLTILKRLIHNTPPAAPVWLQQASMLKSAFLAGGWSSDLETDCAVLKELGNYPDYATLEAVLMPTLALPDRPVDREADVWQVRAPVDAFFFYGNQLTDADLTRLREAIVKVFGKQPEQPSRDQKFNLAKAAPADYSRWLRDGLALTLLIVASMHDVAGLHVRGKTPQQYVDDVINALPDWSKSHHSILRLGDQAALLAEAAPNPFLKALESMLEGTPEQVAQIFVTERDRFFGPLSPHVHFLWALETIAWDPRYLNRAAVVLAKLGQLDPEPDSNHVNRPINSLRDILLGWSPNTYALQPQRIACLDAILRACPDVGWQLLKKLLPRSHDFSSHTQHPKLRDFAPEKPEEITFGLVWDFEAIVVDRALVAAGDDETRLGVFVEALGQLQTPNRAKVLARVDSYLAAHQTTEGCTIWHTLKDESARNEYFGDSGWALTNDDLAAVKEVVERHRPADPLVSDRHAFDDWTPHIGKYKEGPEDLDDPTDLRKEVLQRVLDRDGVPGVLRLAGMVKLPELLGQVLSYLSITFDQVFELMQGALVPAAPPSLSYYVSAAGVEKFGDQWKDAFKDRVLAQVADDAAKAKLLLAWPATPSTWSYVEGLGSEVRDQYWRHAGLLPLQAPLDELLHAIDQFRTVGRDIDVLSLLYKRCKDLPSSLLIDLLTTGAGQVGNGIKHSGNMLSYVIAQALKEVRTRSDVSKLKIAKLEYAYLPLLRHESEPLTVFSLLASDPEMFVDVLSHVFRGKNTPPDQVITAEMKARATISFDLLSAFKTVPGLRDGKIDAQVLSEWVSKARTLAVAKDLEDMGDQRIGYVLAHAPQDAGEPFWPPSAVCKVIDGVAAEHVERGFAIECINKRGVYGKGINEGGGQERDLAARYRGWADATLTYPRTSAMLMLISDNWTRRAEHEDVRAEQGKMKM